MECSKCGHTLSGLDVECSHCKMLSSENTVWPPPIAWPAGVPGHPFPPTPVRNTSGMREGVPTEVAALKWNWGAFFFSWLWCWQHNLHAMVFVISLLGVVWFALNTTNEAAGHQLSLLCLFCNFGIMVYLGLRGHRLAWQNRRFPGGFTHYIAVESAWKRWGLGIIAVAICLGILLIVAAIALQNG